MNRLRNFKNRISLKESIYVCKRISFLLEAGMSLPVALSLIGKQMKKKGVLFLDLAKRITSGQSVADLISENKIFGAAAVPIIRIGEETGTLPQSFAALSDELEKKAILQQKIIGAILYPLCITIGMLILVILLMTFIFPKMISVFESLNVTLPFSTRVLIFLSNFLIHYHLWIILFGLATIGALIFLYQKDKFHLNADKFFLKIPVFSKMIRCYMIASISNILGLLLSNDFSLDIALQVSQKTTKNLIYKKALENIAVKVAGGASLGGSFGEFPLLFTNEFCDLISIGEHTGKLSESFLYAENMHTRDLDALTKSLSSSIEPVLMVFIGLAIGVVALSVVSPMYSITSHLHST